MPNAFEMLGVESEASEEEIRAAYRRLARIYHPDRYANTTEDVRTEAQRRMAELNSAFQAIREGRGAAWYVAEMPKQEAAEQSPDIRAQHVRRETMFRRWEEAERQARRRTAEAHDELLSGETPEDTDDEPDDDDDEESPRRAWQDFEQERRQAYEAKEVWDVRNRRVDAEARAEAERARAESERARQQIEQERAAWLAETGQNKARNKKKRRGLFGRKR